MTDGDAIEARLRRRDGGSSRTLPTWPVQPPDVDPHARSLLLVQLGASARPLVDAWAARAAGLHVPTTRLLAVDGRTAAGPVREHVTAARVGLRVMAAGPQRCVLAVLAAARAGGAVGEEVRLHALDGGAAPQHPPADDVWCAGCGHITAGVPDPEVTGADVPGADMTGADMTGAGVSCAGCGRRLEVHAHLSPRLAARLGVPLPDPQVSP